MSRMELAIPYAAKDLVDTPPNETGPVRLNSVLPK